MSSDLPRASKSFNPLPARRPGATNTTRKYAKTAPVSILSQPEGRELPDFPAFTNLGGWVSILSQPEGRELPKHFLKIRLLPAFQSSPSPKAGSYLSSFCHPWVRKGFNPLPARRPGATACIPRASRVALVSILSQPEGRELQPLNIIPTYGIVFQSSPSPKAGSYWFSRILYLLTESVSILSQPEGRELLDTGIVKTAFNRFQSSPSPKAGSYVR